MITVRVVIVGSVGGDKGYNSAGSGGGDGAGGGGCGRNGGRGSGTGCVGAGGMVSVISKHLLCISFYSIIDVFLS